VLLSSISDLLSAAKSYPFNSPAAYIFLRSILLNFPTLVFGIPSMNTNSSGIHHEALTLSCRNSFNSSAVTVSPGTGTTHASGLSCHLGMWNPDNSSLQNLWMSHYGIFKVN